MRDKIRQALWSLTETEAAALDFLATLARAREDMRAVLEEVGNT